MPVRPTRGGPNAPRPKIREDLATGAAERIAPPHPASTRGLAFDGKRSQEGMVDGRSGSFHGILPMSEQARMMIRLARDDDAREVGDIYSPICEQTAISFEISSPTEEEMRVRIRKTLERFPWLVCADAATVVGYAYAGPHRERAAYRWSSDVTVYVRDGWRRSGVGRALYVSLLEALELLGYHNAYAGIALPNPASVGLHEALGFAPVGVYRGVGFKLGEWRDVGWWHRCLRSLAATPTEPRLPGDVLDTPEWSRVLGAGLSHLRASQGRESPRPGTPAHPPEEGK